jgi:predicted permease
MRRLRLARARLRAWIRPGTVADEIREELEFHVEMRAEEYSRGGHDAAESRRRARRQLGSLALWQDRGYDVRGGGFLKSVGRDVRYALRRLKRQPAFVLVAAVSLGLGIGATVAIVTLIDAVLLRPLPVRAPDELVLLRARLGGDTTLSWSVDHYESLQQAASFDGLCAFRPRLNFAVAGQAGAEVATGQLLSGHCFELLGVRPQLGRLFTERDDREGPPVAVISDAFWRRSLGGDATVIGRAIQLKDRPVTIVGVTPPGFQGLEPGRAVDISVPLSLRSWVLQGALASRTDVRYLRLLARLAPGATPASGASELARRFRDALARPGATAAPDSAFELLPGAQGLNELREPFGRPLQLLLAAVVLLLAVACANLASLMVARAHARRHEIAVRIALGGGRGRIVRQLLTESVVLAFLGGALGLAFAHWASRIVILIVSQGRTEVSLDLGLDGRLVVFATAVTLLASVAFGLWPALRAVDGGRRTALNAGPRTVAPGSGSRTGLLVAAQTTLSVVLTALAILFARSLANLYDVTPGLVREDVFIVRAQPGMAGEQGSRVAGILWELTDRLARQPGVRAATQVQDVPLNGWSSRQNIALPGQPPDPGATVHVNYIGPGFFETIGMPLIAGRDFTADDDSAARPVAIVAEALAAGYFPNRNPLGRHLQVGDSLVEIVGVAGDIPYERARAKGEIVLYTPLARDQAGIVMVRAELPAAAMSALARQALREIAPAVPLVSVTTMSDQVEGSVAAERLLANFAGVFATMATLLVAVGVYGTLSASIAQRSRELGVRIALGETPAGLSVIVLSGALKPVAAGLLLGLPLALLGARMTETLLFGIDAADPPTYAAGAAAVLLAALLAGSLPARTAARTNPVTALRQE